MHREGLKGWQVCNACKLVEYSIITMYLSCYLSVTSSMVYLQIHLT